MQHRVNTKFIFLLIVVLSLIVSVGVAGWWLTRDDPVELEAKGDAMVAQGEYMQAVEYYRKAYKADTTIVRLLWKRTITLEKVVYPNSAQANNALREVISFLNLIIKTAPSSEYGQLAKQKMLGIYYQLATYNRSVQSWEQLYTEADSLIRHSPSNNIATKYRAIAQIQRMLILDVSDDDQQVALKDLEVSLKAYPEDTILHQYQALWHLGRANYNNRLGKNQDATAEQVKAINRVREYTKANPKSVHAIIAEMDIYNRINRFDLAADVYDQHKELLMTPPDDPFTTIDLSAHVQIALIRTKDKSGKSRAEEGREYMQVLLEKAHKLFPDDLRITFQLAVLHRSKNEHDQAILYYQDILRDRPVAVSILPQVFQQLQRVAALNSVEIYMQRYQASTNAQAQAQLLVDAKDILEHHSEVLRNSAYADKIQGIISFAQKEYSQAILHFDSANKLAGGQDFQSLMYSALSLEQLGELGAALDRWKEVTQLSVSTRVLAEAYFKLSTLNFQLRRYEMAGSYIDRSLEYSPENPSYQQLKSQILLRKSLGQEVTPEVRDKAIQESIDLLLKLPNVTETGVQLQLANLYLQKGQKDRCLEILKKLYGQDPKDIQVITTFVRFYVVEENLDAALKLIDKAIVDLPYNKSLPILRDQLTGDFDPEKMEELLAGNKDNFGRALSLYNHYIQTGQTEKANAQLEEMKRLRSDDESVLRIQFDLALSTNQWDEALGYCEQAKAKNLDQAQGIFWFGELELAQGKYKEAIRSFQKALELRSVYSRGQWLLGTAYFSAGQIRDAEATFNKALKINPNNTRAILSLYTIYHNRGSNEQALSMLKRAVECNPYNPGLQNQYLQYLGTYSDPQKALAIRLKYAVRQPEDQSNQRAIAQLYLRMGQLNEAKAILEKLNKDFPNELMNVSLLCVFHHTNGNKALGESIFRQYVKNKGDKVKIGDLIAFARYLKRIEKLKEAEAVYLDAMKLEDPQKLTVSREYADWMFERSEFEKSLPVYQKILTATNYEARVWRRLIEAQIRANQVEAALKSMQQYEAAIDLDVQVHLLKGLLAESMKTEDGKEEARIAYERAIQTSPDHAQPYLFRARFNLESTDPTKQQMVRSDLEAALERDARLTPAREMLIKWFLHSSRRDVTNAVYHLDKLISYEPTLEEPRLKLAEILMQQSNYARLKVLIADSISLFPSNPVWYQFDAKRLSETQNNHQQALERLRTAYKVDESAETLGQYLSGLLDNNLYEAKLAENQPEIDKFKEDAYIMAIQARYLYMTKKEDEAKQLFKKAYFLIRDDLKYVDFVTIQMRIAMGTDNFLSILELWAPEDDTGLSGVLLGRLYISNNQPNQAVRYLEKASTRIKPGDTLYVHMLSFLAPAYYGLKEYEKSYNTYAEYIKFKPNDYGALNSMAYILAENLKQPEKAIPIAKKAAALVGNNPYYKAGILDTLGWVQHLNNDHQSAELTLRNALLQKRLPMIHVHLGQVYLALKQGDKAKEQFNLGLNLAEQSKDEEAKVIATKLLNELKAN